MLDTWTYTTHKSDSSRVRTGSPPNYSPLASNFPIGDEARQVAVSLCRLNCFEEAPLLFIHRGTTLLEINENDSRTIPDSTRTLDNFSWPVVRAIPSCLKTSYPCRAFRYLFLLLSFFFFSLRTKIRIYKYEYRYRSRQVNVRSIEMFFRKCSSDR